MRRLVFLLEVAAAAGGGYALASEETQQAHGSLRSQPLVEGSTSPIGFCTAGRASGTSARPANIYVQGSPADLEAKLRKVWGK